MDLRLPPGIVDSPGLTAWAADRFSLQLLKAALGQRALAASATAWATEMAREWHCDRVFVGVVERRFARVVALSGGGTTSGARPLLADVASAMDEALDQGAAVACPQQPEDRPRVTRAHARLAQRHGMGAVLTVPLFVDTQAVGALMFERPTGQLFDQAWAQQVQGVAGLLAPVLQLQADRDLGVWVRGLRQFSSRWRALPPPRRRLWLAGVPLLAAALAGLMWVPLGHEVAATSTLQGRVQRAVVAPLDGYLKAVHVRAGDSVKAGDLLAELVDDDLRLEQRRRQTEVTQHESAYGDAMARQDRSALVLAEARAAEARAQLGLVEAQLARTRLVAPFDGQVIAGYLQQQLARSEERRVGKECW